VLASFRLLMIQPFMYQTRTFIFLSILINSLFIWFCSNRLLLNPNKTYHYRAPSLGGDLSPKHILIENTLLRRIDKDVKYNSHTDPLFRRSHILKLADLAEYQAALQPTMQRLLPLTPGYYQPSLPPILLVFCDRQNDKIVLLF